MQKQLPASPLWAAQSGTDTASESLCFASVYMITPALQDRGRILVFLYWLSSENFSAALLNYKPSQLFWFQLSFFLYLLLTYKWKSFGRPVYCTKLQAKLIPSPKGSLPPLWVFHLWLAHFWMKQYGLSWATGYGEQQTVLGCLLPWIFHHFTIPHESKATLIRKCEM